MWVSMMETFQVLRKFPTDELKSENKSGKEKTKEAPSMQVVYYKEVKVVCEPLRDPGSHLCIVSERESCQEISWSCFQSCHAQWRFAPIR